MSSRNQGKNMIPWDNKWIVSLLLTLVLVLISPVGVFGQEQFSKPPRERQLEAFLADDTVAAFEILVENPDFLNERTVQVKIYRSQRSKDPAILAAAYRLCFQVPDLAGMAPMIERRCNALLLLRIRLPGG